MPILIHVLSEVTLFSTTNLVFHHVVVVGVNGGGMYVTALSLVVHVCNSVLQRIHKAGRLKGATIPSRKQKVQTTYLPPPYLAIAG